MHDYLTCLPAYMLTNISSMLIDELSMSLLRPVPLLVDQIHSKTFVPANISSLPFIISCIRSFPLGWRHVFITPFFLFHQWLPVSTSPYRESPLKESELSSISFLPFSPQPTPYSFFPQPFHQSNLHQYLKIKLIIIIFKTLFL